MNNPEPIREASEIEFLPGLTVWIGGAGADVEAGNDQTIQFVPASCVFIGEAGRGRLTMSARQIMGKRSRRTIQPITASRSREQAIAGVAWNV
jgi:hypothetical protein